MWNSHFFSGITAALHLNISGDSVAVSDVRLFVINVTRLTKKCLKLFSCGFVDLRWSSGYAEMFYLGSVDWGIHESVVISTQLLKSISQHFSHGPSSTHQKTFRSSSVPQSPAHVWMQQMANQALAKIIISNIYITVIKPKLYPYSIDEARLSYVCFRWNKWCVLSFLPENNNSIFMNAWRPKTPHLWLKQLTSVEI